MSVPHQKIEPKWQSHWETNKVFRASLDPTRPKYYVLDMFPYPSSQGLHVGHPEGYTATDIVARYKRACGFNVLHPMGWDAFGLPAEQYAIQTGVHPAITTQKAIDNFRRQLKAFGYSYDWSREISTCDASYYKWTQWIFLKLYERGLAYQKEVAVNWCPALRTVLANEEVVDGVSERGGHPVVRVPMRQWMLKITSYAERLLSDLDSLDWPERTKEGQKNWIGKSEGARIWFEVQNQKVAPIEIFTTRPDTLFGVTYLAVAPEHPLVDQITADDRRAAVQAYCEASKRKSDFDRQVSKVKSGEFLGSYAIHPLTGASVPIWVADYVLMDYGTGAVMAVPAHDERDYEFAKTHHLPVIRVIEGGDLSKDEGLPHTGEGVLTNSGQFSGLPHQRGGSSIVAQLQTSGKGRSEIQYRLRDWLFSRQRYWGEPFPMVHFPDRGLQQVPLQELPVLLPNVANYEPSEKGESPLARSGAWVSYKSTSGALGMRETDTMPGSAGSSWYFLRFTDPENSTEPFSFDAQKYWMPVDLYLGGAEHTVGHLLYARFWHKVLYDCGLVSTPEPFKKLVHQGMILGEDGEKMSKSRGNVINPDDVIAEHGADALRLYLMFMGPIDRDKPWSTTGIDGVRRFLDRVWRLVFDDRGKVIAQSLEPSTEIQRSLHKTIRKVTEDLESLSFNTAISQMMILVNDLYRLNERPWTTLKTLSQILMPFAPHTAEEIWHALGGEGLVSLSTWPNYRVELTQNDQVTIGVQVNGKVRGSITLSVDSSEALAVTQALAITSVQNALAGGTPKKVIYKAGKILNLIV